MVLGLDEVLLLVLCSGVTSLCVDDGCVGVGGVVRALGLVGQIRSCIGRVGKGGRRDSGVQKEQSAQNKEAVSVSSGEVASRDTAMPLLPILILST